jgi:uncharacterized damage-inducible protein DinB
MKESVLTRLFEHNQWANLRMLETCAALTDAQLDAPPRSATKGTIRETLAHLIRAQQNYLRHLKEPPPMERLRESLLRSGPGFVELAREEETKLPKQRLQTRDGALAEAWVVMVQAINHATEHREQINSMLTDLGEAPLDLDGWSYAEVMNAIDLPPT